MLGRAQEALALVRRRASSGLREPAGGLASRASLEERLERLGHKLLVWCFLVVVGVVAACLSLATDLMISWLADFKREEVLTHFDGIPVLGRVLWVVALALVAHGCVRACPQCAGSGIPELKLILSSTPSNSTLSYLSWRTLLCKLVGITCVIGAGLSVGREGPFVHVSCCVAFLLAPPAIRGSPAHLATVLRAAAAAGVAFTFGAPIGGLLFAAEASVTFFRVSHLPRALICALSGLLAVSWLDYGSLAPFKAAAVEPAHALSPGHTVATIGLGVSCALLATGFNCLLRLLLRAKEARLAEPGAKLLAVLLVAVLTALLTALGPADSALHFLGQPAANVLPPLLGRDVVSAPTAAGATTAAAAAGAPATTAKPILPLGAYGAFVWLWLCLAKLCLTACTIVLPLPCGLFIPTFIAGAFVGRSWSELLAGAAPSLEIVPGAYALVGAAALTASVTGTISTSVIALELTGLSAGEASPLALACVIAIALRGLAIENVYDVIGEQRRLPGHALMMKRVSWSPARRGRRALGGGPSGGIPTPESAEGGSWGRGAGERGGHARSPCRGGYMGRLTAADIVRSTDSGALPRLRPVSRLDEIRDAAYASQAAGLPLVPVVERGSAVGGLGALDAPAGAGAGDVLVGVVSASRLHRQVAALLRESRESTVLGGSLVSLSAAPDMPAAPAAASADLEGSGGLRAALLPEGEREEQADAATACVLDLLSARDSRGRELLDRTPLLVPGELSLGHLVTMFQMLECSQCFVLQAGGYLGTLTREGLSMALSQLDTHAAARAPPADWWEWGGRSSEGREPSCSELPQPAGGALLPAVTQQSSLGPEAERAHWQLVSAHMEPLLLSERRCESSESL